MILIIDTFPDDLRWQQITQLDGREYVLHFFWDDRVDGFFLDMRDQNDDPIATSIALVLSANLLRRFPDPRLPPGRLMLLDLSDRQNEIEQPSDLGARVFLVYFSEEEPLIAVAA